MAEKPAVKVGEWVIVGSVDALVMSVSNESISVGYFQNSIKAIKEEAVWGGSQWQFKNSGSNGSYLHGSEAAAVKRGPPRMK